VNPRLHPICIVGRMVPAFRPFHNPRTGGSMPKIRVLIHDTPTMLRNILEQAISNQPDMEVILEPVSPEPPPDEQRVSPDVVVVDVSDSDPREGARALLHRWPSSHAVMIAANGHRILLYELQPRGVDLGEMSPDQLVQAIRSAARPERKPYAH
jgi:DNA-binding NarL/FixJ family response regulator